MIFFKKHWIALLVASIVGFIAVAPTFLASLQLAEQYRGIQYLPIDDEDIYRARIREILDGHPGVTSPFFYEYKNAPVVVAPLNEWLYAGVARFIGLSGAIILLKFLLPAALFFLAYLLMRRILGDGGESATFWAAIAVGLAVSLGVDLADYQFVFSALISGVSRPILWTRIVNPVVGAVQLFGFLILLWDLTRSRFRYEFVYAGILLASMVGYFFSFTIAGAILVSMCGLALFRKEYVSFRKLLYTGLFAILGISWYWYGIVTELSGEEGSAQTLRNGMIYTHEPVINLALLAATFLVAGVFYYSYIVKRDRKYKSAWSFIGALLAGGWIALNQQIVTGREIWYHHFVQYTIPLSIVAVLSAFYILLWQRFPRVLIVGVSTVGVVSLCYGLFTITSYRSRLENFAYQQEYAPVVSWLQKNALKECVVLVEDSTEELERLIPAYTSCNVYSSSYTFLGVPKERILHNFLIQLRMKSITPETLHEYLLNHESEVRKYFFTDWKQLFGTGDDAWFLAQVRDIEKQFTEYVKGNLENQLRTYRLDYIVSRDFLSPLLMKELPSLTLRVFGKPYFIYSY